MYLKDPDVFSYLTILHNESFFSFDGNFSPWNIFPQRDEGGGSKRWWDQFDNVEGLWKWRFGQLSKARIFFSVPTKKTGWGWGWVAGSMGKKWLFFFEGISLVFFFGLMCVLYIDLYSSQTPKKNIFPAEGLGEDEGNWAVRQKTWI